MSRPPSLIRKCPAKGSKLVVPRLLLGKPAGVQEIVLLVVLCGTRPSTGGEILKLELLTLVMRCYPRIHNFSFLTILHHSHEHEQPVFGKADLQPGGPDTI